VYRIDRRRYDPSEGAASQLLRLIILDDDEDQTPAPVTHDRVALGRPYAKIGGFFLIRCREDISIAKVAAGVSMIHSP